MGMLLQDAIKAHYPVQKPQLLHTIQSANCVVISSLPWLPDLFQG